LKIGLASLIIKAMTQLLNVETLSALREFDEPGKNDFISEIINAYLTDTDARFKVLLDNHRAGNAEAVGKTAHAIKGSSLNVGADTLASLMLEIELEGKKGILSPIEKILSANRQFQSISAELKTYLGLTLSN
jgi:HPt (histidine-containing phosphotransfer) domain-containing protein